MSWPQVLCMQAGCLSRPRQSRFSARSTWVNGSRLPVKGANAMALQIIQAKVQAVWLARKTQVTTRRGPDKEKEKDNETVRRFRVVLGTSIEFDDGRTVVGPNGRVHKGRGTVVASCVDLTLPEALGPILVAAVRELHRERQGVHAAWKSQEPLCSAFINRNCLRHKGRSVRKPASPASSPFCKGGAMKIVEVEGAKRWHSRSSSQGSSGLVGTQGPGDAPRPGPKGTRRRPEHSD